MLQTRAEAPPTVRGNGVLVKTEENYAGKLHSKLIIIDDAYTVISSMNFSPDARESINDENMVIIKNSKPGSVLQKLF